MGSAIFLFFAAVIYFIPLILAATESRPNTAAFRALNLLLGWTFIGWVVALVWALTNPKP